MPKQRHCRELQRKLEYVAAFFLVLLSDGVINRADVW